MSDNSIVLVDTPMDKDIEKYRLELEIAKRIGASEKDIEVLNFSVYYLEQAKLLYLASLTEYYFSDDEDELETKS